MAVHSGDCVEKTPFRSDAVPLRIPGGTGSPVNPLYLFLICLFLTCF